MLSPQVHGYALFYMNEIPIHIPYMHVYTVYAIIIILYVITNNLNWIWTGRKGLPTVIYFSLDL